MVANVNNVFFEIKYDDDDVDLISSDLTSASTHLVGGVMGLQRIQYR